MSFTFFNSVETRESVDDIPLIEKKLFNSETVRFNVDRVQADEKYKAILFHYIERSKTGSQYAIAAANAITILNAARIPFSGMDFRGIKIPGADLTGAILDCTDLSNADLTNVILERSWLRGANLSDASMADIQLGEKPYLQLNKSTMLSAQCFVQSSKGLIAIATDETIQFFDTIKGECVFVFEGHTKTINSMSFSSDGKYLASTSDDNTLRLWDIETKTCIHTFENGGSTSINFKPNSHQLFSVNKIRLIQWDIETGESRLFCTLDNKNGCKDFKFNHDGSLFLVSINAGGYQLWDTEKRECIWESKEHSYWNKEEGSVCFSSDGGLLAIATIKINIDRGPNKDLIELWHLPTHELVGELSTKVPYAGRRLHTSEIISFSADGECLASAGQDKKIKLWDVLQKKLLFVFSGHKNEIRYIAFSLDKHWLFSISQDGIMRTWDLLNINSKLSNAREIATSDMGSIAFSSDGKHLLGNYGNRGILLWNLKEDKLQNPHLLLKKFEDHENPLRIRLTNKNIATYSINADRINLWDVEKEMLLTPTGIGLTLTDVISSPPISNPGRVDVIRYLCNYSIDHAFPHASTIIRDFSFLPNGHFAIAIGKTIFLSPFDLTASMGMANSLFLMMERMKEESEYVLRGHTNYINTLCCSPDGEILVSGSEDESIRWWDIEKGKIIKELSSVHPGGVSSVVFHPSGKLLASFGKDNTICLWECKNQKLICKLQEGSENVCSISFSIDGRWLASGCENGMVRLWDVETKHYFCVLEAGSSNITDVCFSRLNLLATCSEETVCLWKEGHTPQGNQWFLISRTPQFLFAQNCRIDNAVGLDKNNRLLLFQNGAREKELTSQPSEQPIAPSSSLKNI